MEWHGVECRIPEEVKWKGRITIKREFVYLT